MPALEPRPFCPAHGFDPGRFDLLERESDGTGWSVTLRPEGVARFFVVAFLSLWLCGWIVGEGFAGLTLLSGLRDLLAPRLEIPGLRHMSGRMPANPWPVLAFLAVWLVFWTMGGLFAFWTVLRMWVGHDVVAWDHDGVRVRECVGPFGRARALAWGEASLIAVQARGRIVVHARRGLWPVTGGGSADDRRVLGEWLTSAWRDSRGAESEAGTAVREAPHGWVVTRGDDGRERLERDRRGARPGAVLFGLFAVAIGGFGFAVAWNGRGDGAGIVIAATICALLAFAFAALASWLATGSETLQAGEGRLVRERRWMGRSWRRELTTPTLRMVRERDSDGDDRWTLVASDSGPGSPVTLASELHAPGSARALGLWLASRLGVTLEMPESPEDPRLSRTA